MPPPRAWPTVADQQRMDAVALFLDVQHLTRQVERAIIDGDYEEAVKLNAATYKAGEKGQELLNAARRMQ